MPALGRTGAAFAAIVMAVLFQHDDPAEMLAQHFRGGDAGNAAADHHGGAAAGFGDRGKIQRPDVDRWRLACPPAAAAGDELLVMQAGALEAGPRHPATRRFDHRRRAAQVDVDIAVVERDVVQQIGDHADRAGPARIRTRNDAVDDQPRLPFAQRAQFIELAQVLVVRDAVKQGDRLIERLAGQPLRHRQDRRQAGTAGNQHHRPRHLPQVEAALAAAQGYRIARLGDAPQVVGHRAFRQQAHDELQLLIVARRMGVRVAAPLIAAGHPDLRVLTRPVVDRRTETGSIDAQQRGGRRYRLDGDHAAFAAEQLCGVVAVRILQFQHAVGLHGGLAGQQLAGLALDIAEPFGSAHLVAARAAGADAGAANPALAFVDDWQAVRLRCFKDGLIGADRHASFDAAEIAEGDFMTHDGAPED